MSEIIKQKHIWNPSLRGIFLHALTSIYEPCSNFIIKINGQGLCILFSYLQALIITLIYYFRVLDELMVPEILP